MSGAGRSSVLHGAVILASVLSGCVTPSSVSCEDGRVCPSNTECRTTSYSATQDSASGPSVTVTATSSICASREQIAHCEGIEDDRSCKTTDIADGRCHGGVCLAVGCGNGRIDLADPSVPDSNAHETCDDGNQADGDGCSASCSSDETCQNGVIDLVANEQCDDRNAVEGDGCDRTCSLEPARWELDTWGQPPMRYDAAMVWDGSLHQTLLFGGKDSVSGAPLGDTWIWTGNGWRQLAPVSSPEPRWGHRMVFDSTRHRIVMFGGVTVDRGSGQAIPSDETWEWLGDRWQQVPLTTSPGPRFDHGMAYDERQHVAVVYGGRTALIADPSLSPFTWNDTWTFDGTSWGKLAVSGPTPATPTFAGEIGTTDAGRVDMAMAYDPTRAKAVLFGGAGFYGREVCAGPCSWFADEPIADSHTWELDATGWHELTVPAPAGRRGAAFAYDPVQRNLMLHGGHDGKDPLGEEWTWDGTQWFQLASPGQISPRAQLSLATDLDRGAITMLGGSQAGDPSTWDPTSFERDDTGQWTNYGPFYWGYASRAAAYDRVRELTTIVDTYGEAYEFDGVTFRILPSPAASNLEPLTLAYDADARRTVLYAVDGSNSPVPFSALWDGSSWSTLAGSTPPVVTSASMTYDDLHREVVWVGGDASSIQQWRWNGTWSQVSAAHMPPPRTDFAIAYDPWRHDVVLYGGAKSAQQELADTWLWDGTDWSQATVTGAGPRAKHTMSAEPMRQRILMFGGSSRSSWEWDGAAWTQVAVADAPIARTRPVLFPSRDGRGTFMFGGFAGVFLADLWQLRWPGNTPPPLCDTSRCDEPECWYACAPLCDPHVDYTTCSTTTSPRCGDATCDAPVETCWSCAPDCGACPAVCGDGTCTSPESATCPGDCP